MPIDIRPPDLSGFLETARALPRLRGFSVTMPFKVDVVNKLDAVDATAGSIGAVNTVSIRNGRFHGYNTDATGFIEALTRPVGGQPGFYPDLSAARVLLLGAGGAARAIAFALAEKLGNAGSLTIANRDVARARALAAALQTSGRESTAIREDSIADHAEQATLLVNATTKGQAGIRNGEKGLLTLEPYSGLAAARPAQLTASPSTDEAGFLHEWFQRSREDIDRNNTASARIISRVPRSSAFVDVVFNPPETTFLRQARLSGHPTLNGKLMNVAQAVDAFVQRILPTELRNRGLQGREAYEAVRQGMLQAG